MPEPYGSDLVDHALLRVGPLLLRRRRNPHLRVRDARRRYRRYLQLRLHLLAVPLLAPEQTSDEDPVTARRRRLEEVIA